MPEPFTVTFWGVRGCLPAPDPRMRRYGGDTSCVEVRCGGRVFVLDLGSGARRLGQKLSAHGPSDLTVLLSHAHYDHVMGLPFFEPLRRTAARVTLASAVDGGTMAAIDALLRPPFFPVGRDILRAEIDPRDVLSGGGFMVGDVRLSTCGTRHPDGAVAWRIDCGDRSLVYAPDHEAGDPQADEALARFAAGVDLMIQDATAIDPRVAPRSGHSAWREAAALADMAGAKRLALFHHDPGSDDRSLDRIGRAAACIRPGAFVAREGSVIAL